jgi:mycothiol synthase
VVAVEPHQDIGAGPSGRVATFGPIDREADPTTRDRLAEAAPRVLAGALAPELRDDRFDGAWPPDGLIAAVEFADDGRPTGYLGGTTDRGRLQLDGLLIEDRTGRDDERDVDRRADRLWEALGPTLAVSTASAVELWGRPSRPWHRSLAERQGLTELRALHQLRCPLPVEVVVTPVESRPFRRGQDEDALLRVNNRAFADHPDQGGMTRQRLDDAADQAWFDPDGIRLLDDPDRPGTLAGFCWTKIHEPVVSGQPRLGEIYAIGVDPDHHGRGLGVPMTAAGLHWLSEQGLTQGMLYVEADNEPALRTYDRLGFRRHRTDRAWRRDLGR